MARKDLFERYILFKCLECGIYQAWISSKPDGHKCIECHGYLRPIGEYSQGDISDMLHSGRLGKQKELCYLR